MEKWKNGKVEKWKNKCDFFCISSPSAKTEPMPPHFGIPKVSKEGFLHGNHVYICGKTENMHIRKKTFC